MNEAIEHFDDLTVIIPTLNEEPNIESLLTLITNLYPGVHVIVADDGSTDNTQKIVRSMHENNPNIILFDRSKHKIHGLTASVYDSILSCQTEYFFVIDGDFQHPPEKIADGYTLLKTNNCDLVVGYREEVENWGASRKLMSWVATMIGKFSLFLRRKPRVRDIMSGFFGGKTNSVASLLQARPDKIAPTGYKILFDILKQCPQDWKLCEFPYVFRNRAFGKSKISRKHIFAFLLSTLK